MKYLTYLTLILILTSCTIEKRLYRPGYYISSNSRTSVNHEKQTNKSSFKTETKIIVAKTNDTTKKIVAKAEETKLYPTLKRKTTSSVISKSQKKTVTNKITTEVSLPEPVEKKMTSEEPKVDESLSYLALFFGILSLLVVGCIPALIVGAIAKKKHNDNPEKYKNKWMANFGFGIGLFFTIILGFILFLTSIFASTLVPLIGCLVCIAAIVIGFVIVS